MSFRLGLFGGTFDPPHLGHLVLAETALEVARLDQVYFIPAALPPHKLGQEISAGDQRLEMVRLAIEGNPAFAASDQELGRPAPSYTVETLRSFRQDRPDAELFFLMGEDSLRDLPLWREPEAIARLATILVASRHATAATAVNGADTGLPAGLRIWSLDMPRLEISSRDLRRRFAAGQSTRYLVPEPVRQYILRHRLYRLGP